MTLRCCSMLTEEERHRKADELTARRRSKWEDHQRPEFVGRLMMLLVSASGGRIIYPS